VLGSGHTDRHPGDGFAGSWSLAAHAAPRLTSTEGGELSAGVVRPHQPRVLAAPADIASHNYHCQKPDVHHVHPEASKGKRMDAHTEARRHRRTETDEASRNMHDTT